MEKRGSRGRQSLPDFTFHSTKAECVSRNNEASGDIRGGILPPPSLSLSLRFSLSLGRLAHGQSASRGAGKNLIRDGSATSARNSCEKGGKEKKKKDLAL